MQHFVLQIRMPHVSSNFAANMKLLTLDISIPDVGCHVQCCYVELSNSRGRDMKATSLEVSKHCWRACSISREAVHSLQGA